MPDERAVSKEMKSKDRIFHELVELACRFRVILWEIKEDNNPEDIGRELAILESIEKLLAEAEPFIPTAEQLKEWEKP